MANTTDLITDTRNSGRPTITTATASRAVAANSLECAALTGWPTASKVHFITYKVDSANKQIANTQQDCSAIVSANFLTQLEVVDGTDIGNAIGDIVEMLPTAAWAQDLADAITEEHDRTGKHTDITSDSLATGNTAVTGTLDVTGATTLTTLQVSSSSTFSGRATTAVGTTTSGASITPTATVNQYNITALAENTTINTPAGTPVDGQTLLIRIKDAGVAKTIAWSSAYRAIGVVKPTTTVASKTIYVGCKYNSADGKWDVVSVGSEV